jgi:predicted ATPase/class 3 adenylate cyclase/DNA-binding CsgD family transcriptional regulator
MADLPSGTVTLLFTDMEGSTRLKQQLGERYAGVLAKCQQVLRSAIGQWHGQEVDTQGDAFFVVFARASDAASAAVAIQRALASHAWPQDAAVRVRIGMHTGEPQLFAEGYVGVDVNYAARILSAGHGGQILLSQTTGALVESTLPKGVHLQDLGEHRLKDLRRPSRLFQLSITDLPRDFPPLKTLDSYPNNLPMQPTPFVGREQEVTRVCALLCRPEVWLVTLTGSGGMGKTRLGLQVAAELADSFADGVFLVPLALVSDPEQVVPSIIQTLGISDLIGQSPLTLLKSALKDKQLLLLLDNFEQVISAAVRVAELLAVCPRLRIIVTSQVVLRLQAEHEFAVPPLSLPNPKRLPDLVTLSQYEAVALFIQRARAVKPDFSVTNTNALAVAGICARLDGSPLAIELAAARIKFFAPQALLTRLEQGLTVLTGGARDQPTRQQTLRGAIAWSYNLLASEEQQIFRRLAVFVNGCSWEAADVVSRAAGQLEGDVLDRLLSLVDKSLLRQEESAQGEPRFWMLQMLREFGLESLISAGETEVTQQAHAAYYLALAEEAEPQLQGTEQARWLAQLEGEHENLRATLSFLLERARVRVGTQEEPSQAEWALRLCTALYGFWNTCGYFREGQAFLEQALMVRSGVGAAVRARALNTAADLAFTLDDMEQAETLSRECLAIYRELSDRVGIASSLEILGSVARVRGQYVLARSQLEEAAALCQEMGGSWEWGRCQTELARIATEQGQYARACALLEESLGLYQTLGDQERIGWVRYLLARTLFVSQEDPSRAQSLAEQSLTLMRELGDAWLSAYPLSLLGQMRLVQGDLVAARTMLEESLTIAKGIDGEGVGGLSIEFYFSLARLSALHGDVAAACRRYQESLVLLQAGYQEFIPAFLEGLGTLVAEQAALREAARLWGTAEALREALGAPMYPVDLTEYEQAVAKVRRELGEEVFVTAWAEGRTIPLEQALAALPHIFSLVEDAAILRQQQAMQPGQKQDSTAERITSMPQSTLPASLIPTYPEGLTRREVEVLRLVALGWGDAQVAEQLVISPRTVNGHLRSIYNKINVNSRGAATHYAMEHHLLRQQSTFS